MSYKKRLMKQLAVIEANETIKELQSFIGENMIEETQQSCSCEEPEIFVYVHHGSLFKEVFETCLKCGGMNE